jgi:hypothetical protein
MFDLRLESFIEDPKPHLDRLCSFFGVKAGSDYLDDCARIVFKSPKKSRFDVSWDRESVAHVSKRIKEFSFLSGYAYDEDDRAPAARQPADVPSRLSD